VWFYDLVLTRTPIDLSFKLIPCFYKVTLAVSLETLLVRVRAFGLLTDNRPAVVQSSLDQAFLNLYLMLCVAKIATSFVFDVESLFWSVSIGFYPILHYASFYLVS